MIARASYEPIEPRAATDEFFARATMQECAGLAAYVASLVSHHSDSAALRDLEPSVRLLRDTTEGVCRSFRAAERAEGLQ